MVQISNFENFNTKYLMPLYRIFFILPLYFVFSCSHYPDDVEKALRFAGDNRTELEKVLKHYNQHPEDSLKLKAAEFLIANMPYHYTLSHETLDIFRHHIASHTPGSRTISEFENQYGPLSNIPYDAIYDAHVMTADYLIRNIDFSFRLWHEMPWGKHVSFDHFCEEILPYRIGKEPIEDWKEVYYQRYRPMVDTVANKNDPVAVAGMLFRFLHNNEDWAYVYDHDLVTPDLGALALLDMRWGMCREQVEMFIYAMRSVGIPTGMDLYVQHPDMAASVHEWDYMRDTAGKSIGFEYYDTKVFGQDITDARKRGKVYRKYFQLQRESLPVKHRGKEIPSTLDDIFIKDVSSDYFPDNAVELPVGEGHQNGDVMYLSVFNNTNWIPMAWSEVNKGKIQFRYLQPGVLFQISDYISGHALPVSEPFIMNRDGSVRFVVADTLHTQHIKVARKYFYPEWWERTRICAIGGQFQGANKPDFSDAVTLYTIPTKAEMIWQTINLKPDSRKFKYARYMSVTNGRNYIAEVEFFSNDVKLSGKPIGTEGSHLDDPKKTSDKVFDGDPLTYYRAKDEVSGTWTGLEFDKPQNLTNIRYLFRNDDNNIRPGDDYELIYWVNGGWKSLGHQVAEDYELHFENVPTGALFLLHNHTRGKEERPFTYEDGEQAFW